VDVQQPVDVEDHYKVFFQPADIAGKLLAHVSFPPIAEPL